VAAVAGGNSFRAMMTFNQPAGWSTSRNGTGDAHRKDT
jgi:hypothetical protein